MLLNEQNKRLSKLEKQLKDFCEKWEWLDLEDADKTLTESEQKIWEIMQKNAQLGEREKRIKVLDKALELACNELPSPIVFMGNYMETVDDWCKYFKTTARKELQVE